MNNLNTVNWQYFRSRLLENPEKFLLFQYADNRFVNASFHITEIKQAPIISVDCGGKMNSWTEIIVQLWEPAELHNGDGMKTEKALAIIEQVEKLLPLDPDATVKIEFGNSQFDTRQMYPSDFIAGEKTFTISLAADFTQCKALLYSDNACCTPGGGCC